MSSERVDIETAHRILHTLWSDVTERSFDATTLDLQTRETVSEILAGPTQTYRYILVTAVLAKATNPNVHYRSLQAKSTLDGAYNPRTLAHEVVVPWEHSIGQRLGGSNEPYLSTPAQHPEVAPTNPARSQAQLDRLVDVLETLEQQTRTELDPMDVLREVLVIVSELPSNTIEYQPSQTVPYRDLRVALNNYLKRSGGGERLTAVVAGVVSTLWSPIDDDRRQTTVRHVNTSDTPSNASGDIEVYYEGDRAFVIEVKDRPLSRSDAEHSIKKAWKRGVDTCIFVIGERHRQESVRETEIGDQVPISYAIFDSAEICSFLACGDDTMRSAFLDAVTTHLNSIRASRVTKRAFETDVLARFS